ncbi:hypothetical protein Goshw_012074 [Gossypium schwendimanii]|uniref:RNase H type-1 domain-containing protein n=1 Tax=Gossypium schwendimanii TaxID=34291 RepID=A0A7J9MB83_GOSSC|nr:hypothetical protein [Gossypium schwendimanii]
MASCTYPWENISDSIMAKVKLCLQAVTMAEEMGFQDICVEGDALTSDPRNQGENPPNLEDCISNTYQGKPIKQHMGWHWKGGDMKISNTGWKMYRSDELVEIDRDWGSKSQLLDVHG